jgi:hypothetical protein
VAQAYFQGGSPSNYTIGGIRAWFNRDSDLTLTPARREGWRDLGNVVDSADEQEVDILDHFTTKSGTRRKDRSLVREISNDILLTLDELSVQNLRSFFRGGAITNVASASGTTVSADYICQLTGEAGAEEEVIIAASTLADPQGGYNASNISVYAITDPSKTTPLTLDTDYAIGDYLGGYKTIKYIDGGAITKDDFVIVEFDYDIRPAKRFAPATELEVTGQFLLFGVSDTGNEFLRSMEKVQIEPEGSFEMDDEDWTDFQLRVKVLDNTDAVASAPFGLFSHFGTGLDL